MAFQRNQVTILGTVSRHSKASPVVRYFHMPIDLFAALFCLQEIDAYLAEESEDSLRRKELLYKKWLDNVFTPIQVSN